MRKRSKLLTIFGSLAVAILFSAVAFSRPAAPVPGASGYHVIKTIPVGGEGGWDYVYVDSDARRVYVSRGTHVVVLDADTYAVVGDIPGTQGVHGIAVASDLGRGFTSNGRSNDVTIFDPKTLKSLGTVKTDANPDAILYDSFSKRLFTFNGRGKNATAINATDGTVLGAIDLHGKPEFAVADGKGSIFVNNEDSSTLHHLDAQSLKELHNWPLAPCKSPSGLAMDLANRRLFSVCDGGKMAIVDYTSGKLLGLASIGDSPDAASFDAKHGLAFSSNGGDATLSVIDTTKPGFPTVQTVKTATRARTMALDLSTGRVYLVTAQFGATPPATAATPHPRPSIVPDTFEVLVLEK